jgi:hypothetical protein
MDYFQIEENTPTAFRRLARGSGRASGTTLGIRIEPHPSNPNGVVADRPDSNRGIA